MMKLTLLRLDVPLADVEGPILEQLASDAEVAADLVKHLDEEVADWNFTLAMADYFAEQKLVHDAAQEESDE